MDKIIEADLYRYGGLTGFKGILRGLQIPGFAFFLRNCSEQLYEEKIFLQK